MAAATMGADGGSGSEGEGNVRAAAALPSSMQQRPQQVQWQEEEEGLQHVDPYDFPASDEEGAGAAGAGGVSEDAETQPYASQGGKKAAWGAGARRRSVNQPLSMALLPPAQHAHPRAVGSGRARHGRLLVLQQQQEQVQQEQQRRQQQEQQREQRRVQRGSLRAASAQTLLPPPQPPPSSPSPAPPPAAPPSQASVDVVCGKLTVSAVMSVLHHCGEKS